MGLKIISFNISSNNSNIKHDLNTLLSLDADVYCIQELLQEHQFQIETIFENYQLFISQELFFKKSSGIIVPKLEQYNSILIKKSLKVKNSNIIKHIPFLRHPFLYRLTLNSNLANIESQYVDIELDTMILRVVNIHLESFTSPSFRNKQLIHILKNTIHGSIFKKTNYKNSKPLKLCVCGDFNSFATPLLNFFIGYFLQYSSKDFLCNEKENLKLLAKNNNLVYSKFNQPTFKKLPLELDTVLYSKKLKENMRIKILKIPTSSDHYMIEILINNT